MNLNNISNKVANGNRTTNSILSTLGGMAAGYLGGKMLGGSSLASIGMAVGGTYGHLNNVKQNKNSDDKYSNLKTGYNNQLKENTKLNNENTKLNNVKNYKNNLDKINQETYDNESKEYNEGFEKFKNESGLDISDTHNVDVLKKLYDINFDKNPNHTFKVANLNQKLSDPDNFFNTRKNEYLKNNQLNASVTREEYNPYLSNDIYSNIDFAASSGSSTSSSSGKKRIPILPTIASGLIGGYLGNKLGHQFVDNDYVKYFQMDPVAIGTAVGTAAPAVIAGTMGAVNDYNKHKQNKIERDEWINLEKDKYSKIGYNRLFYENVADKYNQDANNYFNNNGIDLTKLNDKEKKKAYQKFNDSLRSSYSGKDPYAFKYTDTLKGTPEDYNYDPDELYDYDNSNLNTLQKMSDFRDNALKSRISNLGKTFVNSSIIESLKDRIFNDFSIKSKYKNK